MTINQESKGNNNEVIGIKNEYHGLSIDDAYNLAKKLFIDNFPKLQDDAMRLVETRVDEFFNSFTDKVVKENNANFSSLNDPDMQYILNKIQINYARFGNKDKLDILTDIVIDRMKTDKNNNLKIAIDMAIDVIDKLDNDQLNYLSLIFLAKHARLAKVPNIDYLVSFFTTVCSKIPVESDVNVSFLLSLNCLALNITNIYDRMSKQYLLDKILLKEKTNKYFSKLHSDYGLNSIGIVIAIVNLNNKANLNIKFEEFVK